MSKNEQISVKVHVSKLFNSKKCLPENLENTIDDDKDRLSPSFE